MLRCQGLTRLVRLVARRRRQMMDVPVEKDLVFAVHDGSDLTRDIYRPPHDNAPVVIYVHGGGGRSGGKGTAARCRRRPAPAPGLTAPAGKSRRPPPAASPRPRHGA